MNHISSGSWVKGDFFLASIRTDQNARPQAGHMTRVNMHRTVLKPKAAPPYNTKTRIKGGGLRRPRWDRTLPLFSIIIEGSV